MIINLAQLVSPSVALPAELVMGSYWAKIPPFLEDRIRNYDFLRLELKWILKNRYFLLINFWSPHISQTFTGGPRLRMVTMCLPSP